MTGPRQLRLTTDGRLDAPALLASVPLQRLFGLLNEAGEAARVVGGAVRDGLLGRPVTDIDIATTAEPEAVVARAKAARLRVIPTGLSHGTVTVVVDGTTFEVTTLRRDIETDGRHAVVRFSRDFDEDAQRRDFTINALSMDADGLVRDPVGGLADLAAGRVRFIGDADRRIGEDVLRILRFFRFHAAYGEGAIDPEGLAAATRHKDALARLSRERVRAEVLKLLAASGAVAVMATMEAAGIARLALGGATEAARLGRLVAFQAAQGHDADPVLRLAALAVRAPDDSGRLREALRLSNDEWRRLQEAAEARARLDPAVPPDHNAALALLFACGERAARDGVALAACDADQAAQPAWAATSAVVSTEARPRMPIGGEELMARGVADGRRVGALLKRLQAAWIRAGFPRDPATLAVLIDAALDAEAGDAPSSSGPPPHDPPGS